MFEKLVVVDCKDHLLGRLASLLAKELMNGQKVVCVRTEEISISGSLYRNKVKFESFLNKRHNTNPKRGPIHYRAPGRILWRVVRGMIPHKTPRGAAALERLKVYEGCPHPFDRMKRKVVPGALRNLRLKPTRNWCRLGDLASQVGWHHNDLIARLEAKRKTKSAAYYAVKKELAKTRTKAISSLSTELAPIAAELAKYGRSV